MPDLIRRLADVPLSHMGQLQAEHIGARLAHKGGISNLMSTPLLRGRQTSAAILKHNRNALLYGATKGLLPMATGEFEGAPADLVHEQMAHLFKHPDIPAPGISQYSNTPGESVDQFWKGRLAPHIVQRAQGI